MTRPMDALIVVRDALGVAQASLHHETDRKKREMIADALLLAHDLTGTKISGPAVLTLLQSPIDYDRWIPYCDEHQSQGDRLSLSDATQWVLWHAVSHHRPQDQPRGDELYEALRVLMNWVDVEGCAPDKDIREMVETALSNAERPQGSR